MQQSHCQTCFEIPTFDHAMFQLMTVCLMEEGKSGVKAHRVHLAFTDPQTWSKDQWITSPNLSSLDDGLAELENRLRHSTVDVIILYKLALHPVHAQVSGNYHWEGVKTGRLGGPLRTFLLTIWARLGTNRPCLHSGFLEPARDGALIPTCKQPGNCCLRRHSFEPRSPGTADRLLSAQSSTGSLRDKHRTSAAIGRISGQICRENQETEHLWLWKLSLYRTGRARIHLPRIR